MPFWHMDPMEIAGSIPKDSLSGLHSGPFQSLLVCGSFCILFCLFALKRCSIELSSCDDLAIKGNQFLCLQKELSCFAVCYGSLSIWTVKHRFVAFGWIWAESIALHGDFILHIMSAVTSSINPSQPVPLALIHAYGIRLLPPCLT